MTNDPSNAANPYAPPGARIEDLPAKRRLANRPPLLARAIGLMWIAFVLGLVSDTIDILALFKSEDWSHWGAPALGLYYLIVATIFVCVWRGRNWARYACVFLLSLGLLSVVLRASDGDWHLLDWTDALYACSLVMHGIAVVLLFTGPIAMWFRSDE